MSDCTRTTRTALRRAPKRAVYDRALIDAVLDEAPLCHLGFSDGDQPYVLPTIHARVGDELLLHGSAAGRAMRHLASGAPLCVTVTLLDGLVLARSAFHHSMNFRSVVLLGCARLVEGDAEKTAALEAFTEKVMPGRWPEVRPPSAKELKATKVLSLAIDEGSAKVRTGPPVDDEPDYALDVWAGVVPLTTTAGTPIPDSDVLVPVPAHVRAYTAHHPA